MEIRDAVEADAESMAAIADAPTEVMRNLIHDRTVRVAEPDGATLSVDPDVDAGDDDELLGFVSFDARSETVHVTQLDGTVDACERLLAEPIRFARREGMDVELLVPETEEDVTDATKRVGFERAGAGPQFDGQPTVRYRFDP